jgi:hypothetical protein
MFHLQHVSHASIGIYSDLFRDLAILQMKKPAEVTRLWASRGLQMARGLQVPNQGHTSLDYSFAPFVVPCRPMIRVGDPNVNP